MHRVAIFGALLAVVGKTMTVFAPGMPFVVLGLGLISGKWYSILREVTTGPHCRQLLQDPDQDQAVT